MKDRETVIEALQYMISGDCTETQFDYTDDIEAAIVMLKEREAKTGHWIYKSLDELFMCSSCEKYSIRNDYPYCHWCGAKMKQEGR